MEEIGEGEVGRKIITFRTFSDYQALMQFEGGGGPCEIQRVDGTLLGHHCLWAFKEDLGLSGCNSQSQDCL